MQVKTISRKMSFGNYQNIEMTAELKPEESVTDAVLTLEKIMLGAIVSIEKRESQENKTSQLVHSFQRFIEQNGDLPF